ncbi:MAG: PIN domain-containing protein [Thermomicrobiales bacterium]
MRVILDTNVIQADPLMRSGRFDVLLEFVKKTESTIVLPQLVCDELEANYARDLQSRVNKWISARNQINGLLPTPLEANLELNVAGATRSYLEYVRAKLRLTDASILQYRNEHLTDVLKRAIARRRPCSDKGEEIRDAVLWLHVLDVAAESNDRVVFVSQNTSQFTLDKWALHPDLAEEASSRALRVEFYPSLEEFGRQHATPIEFITKEWIAQQINADAIVEGSRGIVESYIEHRHESHPWLDENLTGYINLIGGDLDIEEFFVNQLEDGSYRLEVVWLGVVELEYEAEVMEETADWDWDYDINPMNGKLEYQPVQRRTRERRTRVKTTQVELSVTTEALVENRAVVRYQAIDGWVN